MSDELYGPYHGYFVVGRFGPCLLALVAMCDGHRYFSIIIKCTIQLREIMAVKFVAVHRRSPILSANHIR
jgi:hypothetical protein